MAAGGEKKKVRLKCEIKTKLHCCFEDLIEA
jgi:hypothetical protein